MCTLVEPLYARRDELELLYDFPLMQGGGHLRGWAVTGEEDKAAIMQALSALKEERGQRSAQLEQANALLQHQEQECENQEAAVSARQQKVDALEQQRRNAEKHHGDIVHQGHGDGKIVH